MIGRRARVLATVAMVGIGGAVPATAAADPPVGGTRWRCTYSRDARNNTTGSAWRYFCDAKGYRLMIAGYRLLKDSLYVKERQPRVQDVAATGRVGGDRPAQHGSRDV